MKSVSLGIFDPERGISLLEKAFIEIEVVAGSTIAFQRFFSQTKNAPLPLRFSIPEDTQVYTLRTLISEISTLGKTLEDQILDRETGRLKGNTMIALNGTLVDLLGGLDAPLKPGDQIILVPFVDGG